MSDAGGLEPSQDGQAVQMSSQEKASFWFRFAVFAALAVLSLALFSRLIVHESARLHQLWSSPESRQILLMVLAMPILFMIIPSILLFRMCRRKLKYGTFLPSGEELRRVRVRRKRPKVLWKRVTVAVCYWGIASTSTMSAVESSHGTAFRWGMAAFMWMVAILFTISIFQPSDRHFVRALRPLFGKIRYIQIASPRLEQRIRARYRPEIDLLMRSGFELMFWEGETFSIFSIFLVFPALVYLTMLFYREVMALSGWSRILVGQPILASEDKSTYANLSGLGVKFRTSFQNGVILTSMNYGEEGSDGPILMKHCYTHVDFRETWAAHQQSIQSLEAEGNLVDREMSFEAYVEIIHKCAGL